LLHVGAPAKPPGMRNAGARQILQANAREWHLSVDVAGGLLLRGSVVSSLTSGVGKRVSDLLERGGVLTLPVAAERLRVRALPLRVVEQRGELAHHALNLGSFVLKLGAELTHLLNI